MIIGLIEKRVLIPRSRIIQVCRLLDLEDPEKVVALQIDTDLQVTVVRSKRDGLRRQHIPVIDDLKETP